MQGPPSRKDSRRLPRSAEGELRLCQQKDLGDGAPEKYDYQLKPEMRTFGAVIVHIGFGNIYAARAVKGEKVKWDDQEQDPSKYKTRSDCVALLKKSVENADAALKANPEGPSKNMEPFLAVLATFFGALQSIGRLLLR